MSAGVVNTVVGEKLEGSDTLSATAKLVDVKDAVKDAVKDTVKDAVKDNALDSAKDSSQELVKRIALDDAKDESPRSLASIVRIVALNEIVGADKILAATVKGWTCVVSKSDGFAVGQLAVYFEIDSLLPTGKGASGSSAAASSASGSESAAKSSGCSEYGVEFDFLNASGCFTRVEGVGEGYRIKTRKVRGVVSQGLLMPLAAFGWRADPDTSLTTLPAESNSSQLLQKYPTFTQFVVLEEGLDVTARLGVKKYEPPDGNALPTLPAGVWPPFLKRTQQPRIQNWMPWTLAAASAPVLVDLGEFEVTMKLDGTSCTVFYAGLDNPDCSTADGTGVCSRNLLIKRGVDGGVYAKIGDPVAAALKERGLRIAVQGEIMGPKIGGNREKLLLPEFFVFDIWDIDAQAHWPAAQRRALCLELGLAHVPVIEHTTLARFKSVADFLAYAERPSMVHPVAEGVVFKSLRNPSVSFKVVSQSFLLKEK